MWSCMFTKHMCTDCFLGKHSISGFKRLYFFIIFLFENLCETIMDITIWIIVKPDTSNNRAQPLPTLIRYRISSILI